MARQSSSWRRVELAVLMVVLLTLGLSAQRGQPPAAGPPPTPQAIAPVDLTGTWVSVVTEDWRWRMVTPPKGDVLSLPVTPAARAAAEAWDPAKDVAAGNQCRAYGAAGIMRMPGRVRISWQDPFTLKVETDAGTQTRLFNFDRAKLPAGERTWQGSSYAEWELIGARGRGAAATPPRGGSLKVITNNLRSGYVRRNGVPYSENTVMTEYYDRYRGPNGDEWFTVTTVVDDRVNFQGNYVTSTDFKKEADGAKWHPTPCVVEPPLPIRAAK